MGSSFERLRSSLEVVLAKITPTLKCVVVQVGDPPSTYFDLPKNNVAQPSSIMNKCISTSSLVYYIKPSVQKQ